ncbi:hypothetical protein D9M71_466340 [compost metagenome]
MVGHGVQRPRVGAAGDERLSGVATLVLVGEAEGVAAVREGEHRAEVAVVDVGAALVAAVEVAHLRLQPHAAAQRQAVDEVAVVLAVVVLQFGEEVGGGQVRQRRVGGAGVVEAVAGDAAARAVGEHAHVLVIRRIAQARAGEAAAGQGQLVDVLRHDLRALEGLRQQARVVAEGDRQQRRVGADGQHAVGGLQLEGRAEEGKLVGRLARPRIAPQRPGAAGAGAGIQLHPEQPQRIHADADGAVGVAGLETQHEALRPFLGLGHAGAVMARRIRQAGITVVAVHVEVAQFQAHVAVIDEVRLRGGGEQASAEEQRTQGIAR